MSIDRTTYELSEPFLEEIIRRRFSPEVEGREGAQRTGGKGAPVTGIPYMEFDHHRRSLTLLNLTNGAKLTARVHDIAGRVNDYSFSQQSMSKASAACYAMSIMKERASYLSPFASYDPLRALTMFIREVGNDFTPAAYNQDVRFPGTQRPMNYSHNMGALLVWSLILKHSSSTSADAAFQGYLDYLGRWTGTTLRVNMDMALAEHRETLESVGPNMHLLRQLKVADEKLVLMAYCKACAVMVTTEEAASIYAVLASKGRHPRFGQLVFPEHAAHVHNGLRDHGSYDESKTLFSSASLHAKTGVGGGIMGQMAKHQGWVFAGHHSDLNGFGNSGEVLKWVKDMSRLNLRWPAPGSPAAQNFPPSVTTGRALDQKLRLEMTPDNLAKLEQLIRDIAPTIEQPNPNKNGYYLKLKLKESSTAGGRQLMSAASTRGDMRTYWYVPDNHYMHKIVVEIMQGKAA
jgi:glutaminase